MFSKLFGLRGEERLKIIEELSMDERDEICDTFRDCRLCPMAVIYSGKPFCADVSPHFRIRRLLEKGGVFVTEIGANGSEES